MSKITPPPALSAEQAEAYVPKVFKPGTTEFVPMVWMQRKDLIAAVRSALQDNNQRWLDMLAQQVPKCQHGNWIDCAICDKPAAPVAQQADHFPDAGKMMPAIDWSQAGRLMEAAMSASHAGFTVGTTNWAAHICRAMLAAAPEAPAQAGNVVAVTKQTTYGEATAYFPEIPEAPAQAEPGVFRNTLRLSLDHPNSPAQASAVDERKPLTDGQRRAIVAKLSEADYADGDEWDNAMFDAIERAHGITKGEAS